jgi:predicted nucleotidyltransferase
LEGCLELTDQQQRAICSWAEGVNCVQVVRLFGSRAKGTARPDSDVDLALTLRADTAEDLLEWVQELDAWEDQLSARLGLEADVWIFHRDIHPSVLEYCNEASVVLWTRTRPLSSSPR